MSTKEELIQKAYSRKKELSLDNHTYCSSLFFLADFFLNDDLNNQDDITTSLFSGEKNIEKKKAKASIVAKEDGIVSGTEEVAYLYGKYNAEPVIRKKSGEKVKKGDILMEIKGEYATLLKFERIGLNLLQRMSGIATAAGRMVASIKESKVKIAGTRKVQFGMLDKKALEDGGAYAHRIGLYESFLIKDNHLEMLKKSGSKDPVKEALETAFRSKELSRFIEVETKTKEETITAAEMFKGYRRKDPDMPFIIMLDNLGPAKIKDIVKELEKKGLRDSVILEASGGINEANIKEYAESGADVLSVGAITHSVKVLDISQNIV